MDGEDRREGLGQGGMREKKQKGIVALGKKRRTRVGGGRKEG